MKKIILALLFSGIFTTIIHAQTDKGDWLVGGRVDINTGDNSTHIGFSPNAGVFIINNLAVGGNLMIDYTKSGDAKYTDFGIGPFLRWYFTHADFRPLLQTSLSYLSSKYKEPGFSSSNSGVNFFLGAGLAAFINENVSIEGIMGYSNTKYKGFDGSGGFNFGIGFQVYLTKRQVERLRGN